MKHSNLFKSLLLALIATMLPQFASAYDFMVDGLCYNYNSDGTSVTVTYQWRLSGTRPAYTYLSGALTIPNSVTYNGNIYSVTAIEEYAFYYCSDLTSVSIPSSVTSVGYYAFAFCTGLTEVNISDIVAWCNIDFDYAANPLNYAHNLILNGTLLTNLVIPDGVSEIKSRAFESCTGLTSVTIPNSVTTIGDNAFSCCSGLTSVTIPNSVTSIGKSAFFNCSGLTSIEIPNSVTTIGNIAFMGCSGLTSVNISDLEAWCNIDFYESSNPLSYAHNLYLNGSKVTNLVIPNSVTAVKNYSFSGCSGLTSVTIPNSVTSIGVAAFSGCTGLTSVVIPNSVTSIGNNAFSGCRGLTSVTIGNSVTSIDYGAFYRCGAGLKNIIIPENVIQIGESAFRGVDFYPSNATNEGDGRVQSLIFRAIDCNEIGNNAFAYDDHPGYGGSPTYTVNVYDRLVFGDKVTIIPQNLPKFSFGGKELVLPNSVKKICANSLIGTANALVLGDSIETIEAGAVTQISTVYVSQEEPVDISPGAFSNPQTLYVPVGSRAKYFMATGWDEFANIIEGEYVRANVALDCDTVQLTMGSTLQLTATVTPENASNTTVKWYSSNTSVATVTSSGYVSIVGLGEADIYACVDNSIAICHIVVPSTEVCGITFNEGETLKLNTQRLVNLTATVLPENAENRDVTWTIPDNDVLITKVNGNTVRLMAIGNGTVVITATSVENPDVNASCTIIACPGDANDDGYVTSADITTIYNYILNGDTTYLETSDINGDGDITSADVTNVYNIILGN